MNYLLHNVFNQSVILHPNNIAIIDEAQQEYSYALLNRMANCNEKLLKKIATIANKKIFFVALLSHVNQSSIAGLLGVLKHGAAYVPLDVQSPSSRLHSIIDHLSLDTLMIDSALIVTHSELLKNTNIKYVIFFGKTPFNKKEYTNITFFDFNEAMESDFGRDDTTAQKNQVADDLAYVLHTSGSTGEPKGIMLSHRNACTFVYWMQKEFQLNCDDIVMSRAPLKFDLSVFDIFNTLYVGAKIVCFNWNIKRNRHLKHRCYVTLLERENATVLYTTPSTFIALMKNGLGDRENNLRTVMYAGEPFPMPHLKMLNEKIPRTKIANIYGPTETNIITYHSINEADLNSSAIPLGDVVDDTEILVVNEEGNRICKPDEIGELWCRGGTVTSGYIGLADLTKQKLVQSPFHPYPTKFWRTGDYCYRDFSGQLHYCGRCDHMIKIKGYRVELGDIEAGILKYPLMHECCVLFNEQEGKTLCCVFSMKQKGILEADKIKAYLKKNIPEYMIPSKFIQLEELPKTSSEKIDRVYLAERYGKRYNSC